jgi:hypothetical protein
VPRAQPAALDRPARPDRPDTPRRPDAARRLFALPGRLIRSGRRETLHLPTRWPWQTDFIEALTRIRALAAA